MNLADQMADDFLSRDLELLRAVAGQEQAVARRLRALEREMLAALDGAGITRVSTRRARERRIRALQREIRALTRRHTRNIGREVEREHVQIMAAVSQDTVSRANQAVGFSLLVSTGLNRAHWGDVIENILIDGAPPREWWDNTADSLRRNFINRVRTGALTTDEDLDAIRRRVRGTPSLRRQDGVMAPTTRQASAIVRTGMNSVVNEARLETYRANSEVIKGVQASNPLDSRTSPTCRSRAGMAWNLATGEPFPGMNAIGRFPGAPPWHWGCRTVLIPIFKEVESLDRVRGGRSQHLRREMKRLADQKRVALDGKPARGLTYTEFLNRRSPSEQRRILGPARFEMWESGRLSLSQLVNQRGRPLTIAQLEESLGK